MIRNVLVVEDHQTTRERYMEQFPEIFSGASVDAFSNYKDGMESARKKRPDLCVTDKDYPLTPDSKTINTMAGIRFAKEFKTLYPDIPVVIISGSDESLYMEEAKNIGADYYIKREFTVEKLAEKYGKE